MNIFLVGANGQIGQKIVTLLSNHPDHAVTAMVRDEQQAAALQQHGVSTATANLEGTVGELANAMSGHDAVIFSAGSGGQTGSDKTLLVDLDGAVKTMEAAQQANISRFVMVSALQAHHRENWNDQLLPYYVAKHYADRMLEASALNYTIVRPGGLLNEDGTGKVAIAENLQHGSVSREDVARTILEVLHEERTFKRAFDLTAGNTPIAEALKTF
ncbi:hypothetical protein A374_13775 [Fictibacillus macauensis ZFHKF-1]|uniref:NAD(P)-binding domain-containing protein n=1 Tax=Fictibacillus macauensis ZFHKF-1 TaxID=1196324 RepID=I8UCW7_9BACL|nr:SDR family oxidoreductase [Fictibacillus macauensis]EIT84765.1 hypothetical protein A374_13775 [Fictibacillus macauensis ZFHKF-1]